MKLQDLNVKGVKLFEFKNIIDPRGNLTVGNFGIEIPFMPKRYFIVSNVPDGQVRGEHAHKECHQFLVCAQGRVKVIVDDGRVKSEVILNQPNQGLYLPPGTWGVQKDYSLDCSLVVFASHYYDKDDYLANYDEFKKFVGA
jgi:UDP-2-acetamido-3-amino-2,3-dideoxy-glucuronate N-acetyltransferase